LVIVGCGNKGDSKSRGSASSPPNAGPTMVLRVAYSSEKKTWMDAAVQAFEATNPVVNGKRITVEAKSFGSGEASQAILDGTFKAHVYSPASAAYLALLNKTWQSGANAHSKPLAGAGEPLVLSPIVIAMWKPMAEALGWPGKDIGWKDIIRVSKDPKGWGTLGHSEWGDFKLGHTQPELSNSGLLAVLAEAYAGAGKTRGLGAEDVADKKTRAYLASIENAIVHYGKSTGLFTDKMLERGPAYMSACVTYENLVIESYGKTGAPFPLVAVYPTEGTFWSDHPYAVLDAEWVGADERAAAKVLLDYLRGKEQQEAALALGFRPADPSIATRAPIDAAHGVDPKQPMTLLEVPSADTLAALLTAWRDEKKTSDVLIVFDRSGSMSGNPMNEAKAGARAFLDALGDRDSLQIMFFDHQVPEPTAPQPLARARATLRKQIDNVFANGGTALYDAIGAGYDVMLARSRAEPGRIHALVVMTDGQDTDSKKYTLESLARRFSPENAPVKIFTIAYGAEADIGVLDRIAQAGQGTSARGSAETIVGIYRDLSAFF
jgi:Ca-activated chloride channel family protein